MAKNKTASKKPNSFHKKLTGIKKQAKKQWSTLSHKGPMLAPPFKRVPGQYKLKYKGKNVTLSKQTEENAMLYVQSQGRIKSLSKAQQKLCNENFWKDWHKMMTPNEKKIIKDLRGCDFSQFAKYREDQALEKKNMSRADKNKIKAAKEKLVNIHKVVIVDRRKELVSNCMVEPPGLYMGRGANKNLGKIKKRIERKDITINCSNPRNFPKKNEYAAVISNPGASWIASWYEPISQRTKYIQLHASSSIKTGNDRKKFTSAARLARKIKKVKKSYERDLESEDYRTRQHATATYLIHNFALRAGNEKMSTADTKTVGCCSLKVKNLTMVGGSKIRLNFLGKDSVDFNQTFEVTPQVTKNLKEFLEKKDKEEFRKRKNKKEFRKMKKKEEKLFEEINTTTLNQYLDGKMEGLTAKVFRTYRATEVFNKDMAAKAKKITKEKNETIRALAIKSAFVEVAKFLNHRTLTNTKKKAETLKKFQTKVRDMEKKHSQLNRKRRRSETSREVAKRVKLQGDIKVKKEELKLKTDLVHFAPNTSKANYIDPRDITKWCEKLNVPLERIFTKAEQAKFKWAVVAE